MHSMTSSNERSLNEQIDAPFPKRWSENVVQSPLPTQPFTKYYSYMILHCMLVSMDMTKNEINL